jgi:hypothetical protein
MRFRELSRKAAIPAGIVVWMAALGFGFHRLTAYSLKPGVASSSLERVWPSALRFSPAPDHCTLVVTLHPECPCSQATLTELARIVSNDNGLRTFAVFESYDSLPEEIEGSKLWQEAVAIPGLTAVRDNDGKVAALLGARTSGEVRVFSPNGSLLYSGGITGSRGHAGANPASDAVIALVTGKSTTPRFGVPTFGCALDR